MASCGPDSGRCRPSLVYIQSKFGLSPCVRGKSARVWPIPTQNWPRAINVGPVWAEIGPNLAACGQYLADVGRNRHDSSQLRANFAPKSAQSRQTASLLPLRAAFPHLWRCLRKHIYAQFYEHMLSFVLLSIVIDVPAAPASNSAGAAHGATAPPSPPHIP